ncbi:MAG: methyl-accepting chemotaxis protein, partial [Bacteroidales bacterium]|nr:methyl-accepting chemotaxis protein [Bacteroidales bacterium]
MKWLNDIKIGRRLNIILSLVMMLIIMSIGIFIITEQKNKIIADTDLRMTEQVEDLVSIVDIQTKINTRDALNSVAVADHFYHLYKQRYLDSITNHDSAMPFMELVSGNHNYVDKVSNLTGGNIVSVFKRTSNYFQRVSTSLVDKNGMRSTGTTIENSSPVAQSLLNGQKYTGRAIVIDDWYITSYLPIVENHYVIGAIGVGIHEKDMDNLRKLFLEKKYFDTGYPFMIDSEGTFIIHPKKEGENVATAEFFTQIINSNKKQGKTNYTWEGRKKYQYFKYAETIDSFISVSIYEDELMGIIYRVRNIILIAMLIGISIFILIINLVVKSITGALQKGVNFAEQISAGDLNQLLDINQKDEVGQLAASMNNMVVKLKEIIGGVLSAANNVASAGQQTSSTSEQLSQGANEQAATVEEVSSTMEEIASSIQQNTDNAQQTESVSVKLQEGIHKVNEKSRKSVDATRIIADKIKIINDIAFQT